MKTWKTRELEYIKDCYGDVIAEYEGFTDDRRLYCNTYNMLIEAIESLQDDPNVVVRCAMNNYINDELQMMARIKEHFTRRAQPGGKAGQEVL